MDARIPSKDPGVTGIAPLEMAETDVDTRLARVVPQVTK
jgi:hypothetical protein